MSKKQSSVCLIVLIVVLCLTIWIIAAPVTMTLQKIEIHTPTEEEFREFYKPLLLDTAGPSYDVRRVRFHKREEIGGAQDYREITYIVKSVKLTPLPLVQQSILFDHAAEENERVLCLARSPYQGKNLPRGSVSDSIFLYTKGMSDDEIREVAESMAIVTSYKLSGERYQRMYPKKLGDFSCIVS